MTEIVKINDAQIECIKEEGDVFVAMKPIRPRGITNGNGSMKKNMWQPF